MAKNDDTNQSYDGRYRYNSKMNKQMCVEHKKEYLEKLCETIELRIRKNNISSTFEETSIVKYSFKPKTESSKTKREDHARK